MKYPSILAPVHDLLEVADSLAQLARTGPDPAGRIRKNATQIYRIIGESDVHFSDPTELTPQRVKDWVEESANADYSRRVELMRALRWIKRAFAAPRS
jgi:hypothetical protein